MQYSDLVELSRSLAEDLLQEVSEFLCLLAMMTFVTFIYVGKFPK